MELIKSPQINGKEMKIYTTAGFNETFGSFKSAFYISIAISVLQQYPVDMLIFEMNIDKCQQVRLAGYDFNTNKLDEETIAYRLKSTKIKTFWFKVDDYGQYYAGTFLFPEEY